MAPFQNLDEWIEKFPELEPVLDKKPTLWLNPNHQNRSEPGSLPLQKADMEKGKAFMERYAPYIAQIFPATARASGHIHSPLREIEAFKNRLNQESGTETEGRFFIKCDHELPVGGSIKARGGFFEVLNFAHQLSLKEGLINEGETARFSLPKFRELFSQYTIGVGSTGNLGLSIGIISARLGFRVKVYMSHDAKAWKKNLLREKGAQVMEEKGDFGAAIAKGREETLSDPFGYFVDDENSSQLFLGYSLAAYELQKQLEALKIRVDKEHPLFIYSPCGVGGSPGGVLFGLKTIYGDAVHSFFAEPTDAPAVLTGLITGRKEKICVQDFGIDNLTEADGLAVGRPSAFASGIIQRLVSGIYTIEDATLLLLLRALYETEGMFIEPSATAGLIGPQRVLSSGYLQKNKTDPSKITHIAWSTGGSLVPEEVRETLLKKNISSEGRLF